MFQDSMLRGSEPQALSLNYPYRGHFCQTLLRRKEMGVKTYQELQHEKAVLEKEQKRRVFEKEVKKLRKQVHPSRIRRFFRGLYRLGDYSVTGLYYVAIGVSWMLRGSILVVKWLE